MILSVMNQKGGVGKTTTVVTVGHGLARRGHQVLLVDLDAQGNVADSLGQTKWPGLYNLLLGGNQGAVRNTSCDAGIRPRLDLIGGDKRTVEAKQILTGMPFRERVLANALADYDEVYDVIILDVAPGVDVLQISALVACDAFLLPVKLEHLAVVGAADALASAAALHVAGSFSAEFLGVLPTFWERTTNESAQQLEVLAEQYRRLVWPPIPLDTKAREAPAYGQTLWEYAPGCRALVGVDLVGSARVGGYEQVVDRLEAML